MPTARATSIMRVATEIVLSSPIRSLAASIGVAAGVLLAAWGVFIRLNKSAEELEPEAMAQAKSEDEKVQ